MSHSHVASTGVCEVRIRETVPNAMTYITQPVRGAGDSIKPGARVPGSRPDNQISPRSGPQPFHCPLPIVVNRQRQIGNRKLLIGNCHSAMTLSPAPRTQSIVLIGSRGLRPGLYSVARSARLRPGLYSVARSARFSRLI